MVDSIDRLLNMILLELTVAAAVNVLVEKEEEAAAMPAEWNAPGCASQNNKGIYPVICCC